MNNANIIPLLYAENKNYFSSSRPLMQDISPGNRAVQRLVTEITD